MKLCFAKKKDFVYFFKNDTILYSSRAWVLKDGKNRIAIGGIWIMPSQFTSFIRVKYLKNKKLFWKACKYVTDELIKLELPIVCFRDQNIINSKNFLEKLGYVYLDTINNQEVYKLCKQQSL